MTASNRTRGRLACPVLVTETFVFKRRIHSQERPTPTDALDDALDHLVGREESGDAGDKDDHGVEGAVEVHVLVARDARLVWTCKISSCRSSILISFP